MNTNRRPHQIIRRSWQRSERNITELLLSLICLITLIVGIDASAQAQVIQEEDTQQWNDLQISVGVTKQVDFNIYTTIRFGRDISHMGDRRTGVGFTFRAGKYLTFTPNYLNIVMRPFEGRKINENRLTLPITVRVPLGKFLLSDRNQFERRLRFPLNSTRYRNRLQIEHPIKIKKTSLQLFAFDEVFYDWIFDAWVRNRIGVGVSRRFNKYFTGDVYYLNQADGRSRPGDLHVIGATYRLRF